MTRRRSGGLRYGLDGCMLAIAIVQMGKLWATCLLEGGKAASLAGAHTCLHTRLLRGISFGAVNGRTPHDSKSRPAAWNNRAAPASQRERDLTWVSATNRAMPKDYRSDPPYGALEVEQVERPSQGQRHGWNFCR